MVSNGDIAEIAAELAKSRRIAEDARRWLAGLHERLDRTRHPSSILDAAIRISRADFGNIQLVNPESSLLEIIVQRGFDKEFLEFFSTVGENYAACGTAKTLARRVVVEDVRTNPIFARTDVKDALIRARVLAVQSTPIFDPCGNVLGVISTHFSAPHRPTVRELQIVDFLAGHASTYIKNQRTALTR
jgi:GAF domain-containing protein